MAIAANQSNHLYYHLSHILNVLFTIVNILFTTQAKILLPPLDTPTPLCYSLSAKEGDLVLTMGEKIHIMMKRRNMTVAELAKRTGQSKQNLYGKLNRDNFSERDLHKIAAALDCTYFCGFKMEDTGETI